MIEKLYPSKIYGSRRQMNVHEKVDDSTLHMSGDIVHEEGAPGVDHFDKRQVVVFFFVQRLILNLIVLYSLHKIFLCLFGPHPSFVIRRVHFHVLKQS
jgi:hypothetical protein